MKKRWLQIDLTSAIVILAYFGFTAWTAYSVFHDQNAHIYAENGLIENAQASLLAITCFIYLATATCEKRSDKLIIVFLTLLSVGFLLRELDLERLDIPHALQLIGSGAGRNTLLGISFAALFIIALFKRAHYQQAAIAFAKSKSGGLLIAGGVFLLLGEFFEESHAPHHGFFEESAELFGYLLIVLSAIASNSFLSKITLRPSQRK